MSSSRPFRLPDHTHDPYGLSDSDDDLPLEELDPQAADASSARPANRFASNGWGLGTPGSEIQLKRLYGNNYKDHANKHLSQPSLDSPVLDDGESGASHFTGNDEAPLLPSGAGDPAASTSLPASDAARPQKKGLSGLIAKMKSTPQSQEAEEYDPSTTRSIAVAGFQSQKFPPNIVSNAKYTPWSFLPRTLYNEFSFFFNMYFLLVALSQTIPALRIGYLSTYIAPLAFVITITLGKEAYDDITRRRRDAEANSERYTVLAFDGQSAPSRSSRLGKKKLKKPSDTSRLADGEAEEADVEGQGSVFEITKQSKDLRVGDVLKLGKDQRVPADCVVLKSYLADSAEESKDAGEAFIRTDQLDGETDWKLRLAPALSQTLDNRDLHKLVVHASKPERKVNEFVGNLTLPATLDSGRPVSSDSNDTKSTPLTIDNTAWANTVLASNASVLCVVVYTGSQTRQALSTSASRSKTGLLEYEINSLTKILCFLTALLSIVLVILEKVETQDDRVWYVAIMRYLILFSTIVPISLRVNLDLGKSWYAGVIHRDKDIPDTIVRTSTIPEDLGRIEYLLTDKTGTLTQNDMQLRKIHVGTVSYANEAMTEVASYVRQGFGTDSADAAKLGNAATTRSRREISSRVRDVVLALALCHNVTPTTSTEEGDDSVSYQASSPDEIAIVRWTESVGLRLAYRDRHSMTLESTHTGQVVLRVQILFLFPFTSDGKRMGTILRFEQPGSDGIHDDAPIWFFQKGADTVMSSIVASNDWLDEETGNMAREGLRTLVVGRKRLSPESLEAFTSEYRAASVSLHGRDAAMAQVVLDHLEHDLELLGVTGVEDKLQRDVKPSLELLRNAGVKIWMLTGDKVETARCVAISAKLVARGQYVHTIARMSRKDQAGDSLVFLRGKPDACLLIDGESLALMLTHHREEFIATAVRLSAVVACRCSPTQKADVAQLIRTHTKKRVCCIGDGGNDVSMIQAADVGVGIVGKEGRQASLAADFSITQFCHLTKLLVWHGRNSYKRSAKLAQFVIHRGLIISVCQTVFSVASEFEPIALYRDWLLVGYATIYTMMPVFSLVLDTDIPPELAHVYPELYAELSTSKSLSYKTFFVWVAVSIYQGCAIQVLSQLLIRHHDSPEYFSRMVSVSYTVLVLNELVMVAAEVTTWHWVMIASIIGTACIYLGSLPFLGGYFDLGWLASVNFVWRVAAIAGVSLVPVYAGRVIQGILKPPNYRKVQQGL
ncbi:hypothetical protein FH972_024882 [Carpinus fangiana]|uniref:Phospholipid-transporting ATPase n=1 Tax=Carpinus fangiana TaxID=176857 RepID=A0A5N6KZL2_9ROSI|nr:hypothetical protein FH972_024882 [Carpinus fangiana]